MEKKTQNARYTIVLILLLCYLLPLVGLTLYATTITPASELWNVLSIGLALTFFCSLAIFWAIASQVNTDVPREISTPPAPQKNEYIELYQDAMKQNESLQEQIEKIKVESEGLHANTQAIQEQLEEQKRAAVKQLQQQQTQIRELQGTIADQKSLLEKKQQQISQLDTKVNDLTYEIKTLLQLAEAHTSILNSEPKEPATQESYSNERQIQNEDDASSQLKHCVDIAQKMTGSSHFGSYTDSRLDTFSIDLRRLGDNLRTENGCAILLYSPKENQLLFANPQIKTFTGWSPDKFIQNFHDLIHNNDTWQRTISSLSMRNEASIQLGVKTKSGGETDLHGQLGVIPTGIFKHHVIAVLYEAQQPL